jgi:hypothetical protein
VTCETNGNQLCEHNCTNLIESKGFVCSCHRGYGLVKYDSSLYEQNETRRHTCLDINECLSFDSHCPQICNNQKGSFKCSCAENYVNSRGDGSICEAKNSEDAVLLIAYGEEIRQLRENMTELVYNTLIEDEKFVYAIDIDANERHVYWIDQYDRTIKRSYIPVSKASLGYTQQLNSLRSSLNEQDPTALGVDWLGKNLYFADNLNKVIKVSTLDGRYTKTVIREHADEVYSLAVNPILGYFLSCFFFL